MLVNRNNLAVKDIALKEKDTTRLALTGVYLTPKGTAATDGYTLIRVEPPKWADEAEFPEVPGFVPSQNGFQPVLIPRNAVDKILAAHKKLVQKGSMPILNTIRVGQETMDGAVPFGMSNLEVSEVIAVRKLDEEFPDHDRVLPQDEPVFSIVLSADRLLKALKVLTSMNLKSEVDAVTFHFFGPERAVYMVTETEDDQKVEVLLMPVRPDVGINFQKPEVWNKENDEDVAKDTANSLREAEASEDDEQLSSEFEDGDDVPEAPFPPDPGVVTTPYIPAAAGGNSVALSGASEDISQDNELASEVQYDTCDLCGARAPLTKVLDGQEELWLCPQCAMEFDELVQTGVI